MVSPAVRVARRRRIDRLHYHLYPDGARDDFFKGRSTWLKLERHEGKLSASYSHDGKEWTEVKPIDVELPRKVQVGVAAVNTSKKPMVVVFEELSARPR